MLSNVDAPRKNHPLPHLPSAPGRGTILLPFALILLTLPLYAQETEDDPAPREEPTIQVDTFGVRVQPQLEFIIPYGVISQRADIPIGGSVISTKADFDLASSAVSGEVGLSRRFGNWEPGVRAYQRSNSEGIAQPRITGGEVRLTPRERYLERERGAVGELSWYLMEDLVANSSLALDESIETLLSEPAPGEEVREAIFEIVPSVYLELQSLRITTPRRSAEIRGSHLRFTLSQRYVDNFASPATLEGRIATLWNHQPAGSVVLEHQLSGITPLYVWDRSLHKPLSLGGFDTLRGFDNGAVNAGRGFLARNTATWRAFPTAALGFDSPVVGNGDDTVRVRVHNLKLLFAADALLAQQDLELTSAIKPYLGAGPGAALTISAGESIHFDLRSYVAWAVGYSQPPIFYLQGAIFSVAVD